MKLEEILERTRKLNRKFFEEEPQNQLRPMVVGFLPSGESVMIAGSFDGMVEKDLFAFGVRQILQEKGAVAYSYVSEAWMAVAVDGDRRAPADREDKEEVVITLCSDKERDLCAVDKIVRDWKTGAVTGLEEDKSFTPEPGGRFQGLVR